MRALELKLPPVAVFLIAGAGMWLIRRFLGTAPIAIPLPGILAGLLAAGGVAIGIAGILAFRRLETTVHPMQPDKATAVVRIGVYRYSRNPMYLGLTLVLCGWAVFLGNPWCFLVVPAFVLYMSRFQIVPEERALQSLFGAEYQDYLASVRRWL